MAETRKQIHRLTKAVEFSKLSSGTSFNLKIVMKLTLALPLGASALAATLLFSGCGGGSNNGPSKPKATATPIPGTTPTPMPGVTPTPGGPTPTPTMAPISLLGQVAFTSNRNGNPDLFAMDAQGNNQRPLSLLNTDSEERSPSVSRDGNTVVWSSNRPNTAAKDNFEIYALRPNGAGGQKIQSYTNDTGNAPPQDTEPVISPDGTKIAWTTTRGGKNNIAVMSITGDAQVVLTNNEKDNRRPAWTSDSRSIGFYSVRGNSRGIYLMNADGSNQRPLLVNDVSAPTNYYEAAFSPDGRYLAVTIAPQTGNSTISLFNADGTASATQFNLPGDSIARSQIGFSPDSQRLVYSLNNAGIRTAALDGSDERILTSASGNYDPTFSN